jgi:transposase
MSSRKNSASLARKLVTVAFLMLKNNEPYRYARPNLMREKFADLRHRGTDPSGTATATKPRRKGKPGLAEVYQTVGLPPVTTPEQLPPGEVRMLSDRDLEEFVAELYRPKAASRGKKKVAAGQAAQTDRPKGRRS